MRKSFHRKGYQPEKPRYQVNQYIHTPQVRLIDEEGNGLGIVDTAEALRMAQERGLDLVEVSPKANPPVAKILNYGSFKYKQEKQVQKQKAQVKKIETKGIRLSLGIGQHDKEIRLKQAREFLTEGNKIRTEMVLRGRERQQINLAREVINKFIGALEEIAVIEQPMTRQGGRLTITLAPKK